MKLETEVAALLRAGDVDGATTAVLRAHGGAAHRFLAAVLGDRALADDAHALFGEWVWRGLRSYEGRASLRVWCFGVAAHAARRVQEDRWRRHATRLSSSVAAVLAETRSSRARQDWRERRLAEVRAGLSESDRSLLVLRLDRELGWREIEDILRKAGEPTSAAALRKRYERLRQKLIRIFERDGLLSRAPNDP